ncbi:MAG: phosphoribosylamine--glycine ligase [Thermoguttaceae bacterium]
MHILIIGSGGREHALAWKLAQSQHVTKVFVARGNAGTATESLKTPIENVNIDETDFVRLVAFARENRVGLVVVGPEVPLSLGVVDAFEAAKIPVFGPNKVAAQIESSKVFCKSVLKRGNVPTAASTEFDHASDAIQFLEGRDDLPCVIKADGLAAGKGVVVAATRAEAIGAVKRIAETREFGDAGRRLLIEERLEGEEVSVLAITDGTTLLTLPPAQDHKAAFDGDLGPNTGGMGAYSPVPAMTPELLQRIEETVFVPTLHALRQMNVTFRGVLYAGLMLTQQGPKVLEYNARFGDPECQPILMRLQSDLFEILYATATGKLDTITMPQWDKRSSVCVVMASAGYPGAIEKGFPITGLAEAAGCGDDVKVFHAGTILRGGVDVVTSGGRVLGVTALGDTPRDACQKAYEAADKISWRGHWMRHDIAHRVVNR